MMEDPDQYYAMEDWLKENKDMIEVLTVLVRSPTINSLQRKIIVALITTDVHARDIL